MNEIKNKKNWYILHVFSGLENKIVKYIKESIKIKNLDCYFGEIIIPSEEVLEIKKGIKRKSRRKFFPGYILIEMIINGESWNLIKNIPYILKFIGDSTGHPTPVSYNEIEKIIYKLKETTGKIVPKILFSYGERVRVNDGPFSEFIGIVENVDYEKNRIIVSISIFGRSTPVELNFKQIEKC